MPEYRIYLIGPDSHFIQSEAILCAGDAAAIEIAKRLIMYGRDVELRQCDRKITKLIASPSMEQPRGAWQTRRTTHSPKSGWGN
jgi:hypothetical protein